MDKKKILCILQLPPPVHGASIMNKHLIESALINHNFDLEIINLQFNKTTHSLEKFSFHKVFMSLGYAFTIVKMISKFRPHLIYFTPAPSGFALYRDAFYVFILKCFKSRIIFHLHGKGINKNAQNSFIKKFLYKRILNNSDVICLSKILTKDIEAVFAGVPFIVPNAISTNHKINRNVKDNIIVPQILYLSNYIKSKGVLVLIDALSILKKNGFSFSARLVGGPENISVEDLESIIMKKQLTREIKVTGPLYNEAKITEFQNADLFVFPTFYEKEAFPLVLLEALQFKIPIISTFEGGISDMISNNVTGILVEGQNVQMLADKIALLLENPSKRNELSTKGYDAFINNYTLEHFENNINQVFNRILNPV